MTIAATARDQRTEVEGVSVSTLHYIDGRRVGSADTFEVRSPIDWEGWKLGPWDGPRLLELFRTWGFGRFQDMVRTSLPATSLREPEPLPALLLAVLCTLRGGLG